MKEFENDKQFRLFFGIIMMYTRLASEYSLIVFASHFCFYVIKASIDIL